MSDAELSMYTYYLERGHSLKSLMDLDCMEKTFYLASMSLALDISGN
ncbi:hypothetical protein [uncultured Ilyobacter sp.]|jgi:hypothetical protein|nr:hypothetical protein [uncultured Ilyobacter sp.]